jgi:hypothetical protein
MPIRFSSRGLGIRLCGLLKNPLFEVFVIPAKVGMKTAVKVHIQQPEV